MFSREDNDRLTRVGPATAMGELLRRYWLPALLTEEIPAPDCPPVRVGLLGEDLVAFRDSNGKVGLLGEHCSHRGTSLFYGRNENCGLTCIYHGWKYDVEGRVLETPAEPRSSDFRQKLKHKAYSCVEHAGIVFAYLGPPEKIPLFPEYEWLSMPVPNRHVIKAYLDCNYLQGLEGDFDSSHTTFLHCNNIADLTRLNRDGAPRLESEESRYGLRAISIRNLSDGQKYIRVSPFIMPSFSIVPGPATAKFQTNDQRAFRFWVPIDDTSAWLYILTMRDLPFSEEEKTRARSLDRRQLPAATQRRQQLYAGSRTAENADLLRHQMRDSRGARRLRDRKYGSDLRSQQRASWLQRQNRSRLKKIPFESYNSGRARQGSAACDQRRQSE
jgi:phenylpropionate dioxygenase-like ring-hydroxylating dioxygenase large terminal subunit